ncbi:hypothetical protein ASPWEDRAFT_39567 [Aspergillus wentii DTO 134E9]|uniref:Sulfotransferase domain-containing protein n=1 Tax=Aspergillus wentii DTO 134E9 TaxID=1073089 RepID=A0A1L9RSC4_ASPWE|nr:uncharacterized protein ASPWEDRAFT_39567 [Aspergillus wentii DTO 134E9]KAI9930662.1 hypothetical protein MW887_011417 [Aspergillus wentii]OJJ37825.1 hypothetical protein ASPWEDRAFT_39567 [Aspergillus wentii DTO 134E9]
MGSYEPSPRQFWLLTYPRTGSNLLVRILGLDAQPCLLSDQARGPGYFFLPVMRLMQDLDVREKDVKEWTEDARSQIKQCYQACFNDMQGYVDETVLKNHSVFVKEHVNFLVDPIARASQLRGTSFDETETSWMVNIPETIYGSNRTRSAPNETILPDEFLRRWSPTFLIRHPALAFPSRYRIFLDLDEAETGRGPGWTDMTMRWTRTLYDWYRANIPGDESVIDGHGDVTWPLIIDADDVMAKPEVVVRFCDILGMDRSKLRFTWTAETEEKKSRMGKYPSRFLSTLISSEGIVSGKTSENVDIDVEAKKWRVEFGDEAGAKLEQVVRAAMPDYEFLKARRLKV